MVSNRSGVDGSRQVTALVDPTGTGNSFQAATVTKNGDEVSQAFLIVYARTFTGFVLRIQPTLVRKSSRSNCRVAPNVVVARTRTCVLSLSRPLEASEIVLLSNRRPVPQLVPHPLRTQKRVFQPRAPLPLQRLPTLLSQVAVQRPIPRAKASATRGLW